MSGKPTCSFGNNETFAFGNDEIYDIHDFNDPRSSLEIKYYLSSRLKIVRSDKGRHEKIFDKRRSGSMDMSLIKYQLRDIDEDMKRVIDGGATDATGVQDDKFVATKLKNRVFEENRTT